MIQSALRVSRPAGLHVAVIMDGNGRWAEARGRIRLAGHRAGAKAVRRTVETAPGLGIGTLTLYAFSADNWRRPPAEVRALMRLFRAYLRTEVQTCIDNDVRLQVIGRRDRLPSVVVEAIEAAEAATAGGRRLLLRVAVDYSSRDTIVAAAARAAAHGAVTREAFEEYMGAALNEGTAVQEVDLLIRTGGEQRLSDFLLWECAYAELYFTPRMWPDFMPADLEDAVSEFHRRERRFGAVPEAATG